MAEYNIDFTFTGLAIIAMGIYGAKALNSPTISFDYVLALKIVLAVFAIELLSVKLGLVRRDD